MVDGMTVTYHCPRCGKSNCVLECGEALSNEEFVANVLASDNKPKELMIEIAGLIEDLLMAREQIWKARYKPEVRELWLKVENEKRQAFREIGIPLEDFE